ncbi:hypothetical protein FISHEDRAFT_34022 [Fistulina hepatica ATCC 64428]|uniref:F-box domain-containing protein n=1 Tax=Fistulina hepatica ATCC 64428 TaxID=1128425 RepID=A0A0D7AQI5_9AGAR|nr:hypothetical protein FISHEDRAFT_34022 [Fistulina hepatica ATCC 64428]
MGCPLVSLNDDVVIIVFSFLSIPEIMVVRSTCRRMKYISRLRIIWMNALFRDVLSDNFPFPDRPLATIPTDELEYLSCRAYNLSRRWINDDLQPRIVHNVDVSSGTAISLVRFIHRRDCGEEWLVTISRGIWSVLTLWRIIDHGLRKACEWSPKSALFDGFTLNTDASSDAVMAVLLVQDSRQQVNLLTIECVGNAGYNAALRPIFTIQTSFQPVALCGDLLALSDEICVTNIINWRTGESAILRHDPDDGVLQQHDHAIQVLFIRKSVLVVRARSLHLFTMPFLSRDTVTVVQPCAKHSFGWVDGVAVTYPHQQPNIISVFVRGESDDPWSTDVYILDLYHLAADPDENAFSPYIFPPVRIAQVHSIRGPLRCSEIHMGLCGTAVWIQPPERAVAGLLWDNDGDGRALQNNIPSLRSHECLMAQAFPGPLMSTKDRKTIGNACLHGRCLWTNDTSSAWTSFDYHEEGGRIALGSSSGHVCILKV